MFYRSDYPSIVGSLFAFRADILGARTARRRPIFKNTGRYADTYRRKKEQQARGKAEFKNQHILSNMTALCSRVGVLAMGIALCPQPATIKPICKIT